MKQPQGLSGPIKLDHVIRVGPAGGIIARGFLTEPAGVTATSVDGLVLTSEHPFVAASFHSHRRNQEIYRLDSAGWHCKNPKDPASAASKTSREPTINFGYPPSDASMPRRLGLRSPLTNRGGDLGEMRSAVQDQRTCSFDQ